MSAVPAVVGFVCYAILFWAFAKSSAFGHCAFFTYSAISWPSPPSACLYQESVLRQDKSGYRYSRPSWQFPKPWTFSECSKLAHQVFVFVHLLKSVPKSFLCILFNTLNDVFASVLKLFSVSISEINVVFLASPSDVLQHAYQLPSERGSGAPS